MPVYIGTIRLSNYSPSNDNNPNPLPSPYPIAERITGKELSPNKGATNNRYNKPYVRGKAHKRIEGQSNNVIRCNRMDAHRGGNTPIAPSLPKSLRYIL